MQKLIGVVLIITCSWITSMAQVPLSEVTEAPSSVVGRFSNKVPPKVILGLAHMPELADVDPNDWTYVREHLDGIWANAASTGVDNAISIAESVSTENYFFIGSIQEVKYTNGLLESLKYSLNMGLYDGMKTNAKAPGLVLVNDYITKSAKDTLRYFGTGYMREAIDYTKEEIFDGVNPFNNGIYITVRTGHFSKEVYNKTYSPATTGEFVGKAFSTMKEACESGGGIVWERAPQDFMAAGEEDNQLTYIQAFNRSRELGGEFIWLMPRGNVGTPADHTSNLVKAYEWFEKNEIFPDKIVVIGYSRAAAEGEIDYLDMLPMINPTDPDLPAIGSLTGTMYWCIKQRENKTVSVNEKYRVSDSPFVYPNPTVGTIRIENPWSTPANISIYNSNGQVILNQVITQKVLNVDALNHCMNGIFFIQISNDKGEELTDKILLNR